MLSPVPTETADRENLLMVGLTRSWQVRQRMTLSWPSYWRDRSCARMASTLTMWHHFMPLGTTVGCTRKVLYPAVTRDAVRSMSEVQPPWHSDQYSRTI